MHLLLATRKRVSQKPPLCKGRWHFREKMTEGLSRKSALSLPANFSKRHNPSPASQELPLHKGAFPIMAPSTKSPHPLFLFTGNSLFRTTLLTRGFRYTKKEQTYKQLMRLVMFALFFFTFSWPRGEALFYACGGNGECQNRYAWRQPTGKRVLPHRGS